MCRAGGRRCPNAGGRSTQNTRQAVSRARRALRQAKEIGNPAEIAAARDRLDTARAAHRQAKENAVNQHHDEGQDHAAEPSTTAGHDGDVTPPTSDQPEPVSPRVAEFTARLRALGRPADPSRPAAGPDPVPSRPAASQHGDETGSPRGTGHGQRRDRPRTDTPHVTVTNTNYAAPGAHVGSQHDVTEGSVSFRFTAGDDRDVTDHVHEALRRAEEAVRRATRHTAHQDHAPGHDDQHDDAPGSHHDRRTTRNVASGNDHVDQQIGFTLDDLRRLRRR